MRDNTRTEPEKPATIELSKLEIDALKLLKSRYKKKTETIPPGIPPIALAVRWIADLGGYTGKSSGGPPGAITIARGMENVAIAAQTLEAIRASRKKR